MSGIYLSDTGMDGGEERTAIPQIVRETTRSTSDSSTEEIFLEVPAPSSTRNPDGSLAIVGEDGEDGGRREQFNEQFSERLSDNTSEGRTVRAQRITERRYSERYSERPENIGHQESNPKPFNTEYYAFLEERFNHGPSTAQETNIKPATSTARAGGGNDSEETSATGERDSASGFNPRLPLPSQTPGGRISSPRRVLTPKTLENDNISKRISESEGCRISRQESNIRRESTRISRTSCGTGREDQQIKTPSIDRQRRGSF